MRSKYDISNRHLNLMVSLFLILAIIVAYGQMSSLDFVNYDDQEYVTENGHVQEGLTVKGLIWAFKTFHSANWHPLTWLSHMLDCELYGLDPMGHHWTNLQFHMANTLLLFFILQLMTGELWRSAFVAALFALHPLHVESVAWISERKDVLSTFFGMLTILAYYRYVKQPCLINYLLTILFFGLGLMAKPMLVTFPFLLLLLDFWPLKRFQLKNNYLLQSDGVKYFGFQESFRLILEKVPLFILVVVSSSLTFLAQQSKGAVAALEALPLKTRVANSLVSYVSYVFKAIWPNDLAVIYQHPGDTLPIWQICGAAFLIVSVILLTIYLSKQYPYVMVGLFWYLGTLVPVIGLVQVGEQAMADRYTYIPLIGIFIIITWGVSDLLKKWHYRKIFFKVSAVIILSALTTCTFFQVGHWKNGITLFENAVKVTENNFQAHNNLGIALGPVDLDRAISHYKEALRIYPNYGMALNNLGNALSDKGNYDEAVLYFTKALKIIPHEARVHNNLGIVLQKRGRIDEAIGYYEEALRLKPDYGKAHYNIGDVLEKKGRIDEAIGHYLEALRLKPYFYEAHNNLGNALQKRGRIDEAIGHYLEALRIKPDYVESYSNLGNALEKQGLINEAINHYLAALRIKPDYWEAHYNLGNIMKKRGRIDEAIDHYLQALRIKPRLEKAHNNLGIALIGKGNMEGAIYHFQEALRIKPDYLNAKDNLKKVLMEHQQGQ